MISSEAMIEAWCRRDKLHGTLESPLGRMRLVNGVLEFTVNESVRIRPAGSWCRLCPAFCRLFVDPVFRVRPAGRESKPPLPGSPLPVLEEFFDTGRLSSREDLVTLQQDYRRELAKRLDGSCSQCELGALRAQFTRQVLAVLQPELATPETRPT